MEVHREPVDIARLAEGVRAVMAGLAGRRGITLTLSMPPDLPRLELDAAMLKQILFNLLSNAVKFSPEETAIEVGARLLDAAGTAQLELTVTDHGIGIKPEDLPSLFKEFRQIEGGGGEQPGTGLGLSLVRKYATLLGGTVAVESTPGQGTTFRVLLPAVMSGVARATADPR
jgi:signal transduction histidine kinase